MLITNVLTALVCLPDRVWHSPNLNTAIWLVELGGRQICQVDMKDTHAHWWTDTHTQRKNKHEEKPLGVYTQKTFWNPWTKADWLWVTGTHIKHTHTSSITTDRWEQSGQVWWTGGGTQRQAVKAPKQVESFWTTACPSWGSEASSLYIFFFTWGSK